MDYLDEFDRLQLKIAAQRDSIGKELRSLPPGRLKVVRRGKYTDHLHVVRRKDGTVKRTYIKRQPSLTAKLCRKDLLIGQYRQICSDIKIFGDMRGQLAGIDEQAIIASMPPGMAALPKEYFLTGIASAAASRCPNPVTDGSVAVRSPQLALKGLTLAEYFRMPYRQNTKKTEQKTILLRNGLWVRSKSEGGIAECAEDLGYVYHYDELLDFGGIWLSPDFIYMRYDGKLIYHEHAGRPDDYVYMAGLQDKLQLYARFGIVLWDNLILTFDRPDGGIDYALIEAELRAKLF